MAPRNSSLPRRLGPDGVDRHATVEDLLNENFRVWISSPLGKVCMSHLRQITILAVTGPAVTDAHLRHLEGQRYLVGLMEARAQLGEDAHNRAHQSIKEPA